MSPNFRRSPGEFCDFREVGEDGVGFGEDETVVVEHRCAAVGIDLEELGGAAFAFQNVDFHDVAGDAEMREQ